MEYSGLDGGETLPGLCQENNKEILSIGLSVWALGPPIDA